MSFVGDPFRFTATVTPSDVTDLPAPARGLYIGGTGNVSVEKIDGGTQIFAAVPVGILSVQCKRVNATGTTATNIVAGW